MYETSERYFSRLLAVWGGIAAAVWLITTSKFVDGVDLYVFVCQSRDMLHETAPDSNSAYRYFPGIYSFWRSVLLLFGQDTPVIQRAVMSVLAVNAVLTGVISWRLAKSVPYGVLGGVLYLCIASRYECTMGTAEPLATIPFLIGLWLWTNVSAQTPVHWKSLLLLGVALGLSVYCKQQAGLLAVGVVWLTIANLREQPTPSIAIRTACKQGTVIASAAAVTLLVAILFEGKGLDPLRQGLQMAAGYTAQGTWSSNFYSIIRNDESVALMMVVALAGIFCAARTPRDPAGNENSFEVVGILCCSAFATTLQFRTRGYYHYFLLAIPCLVAVFVFAVSALSSRFQNTTVRNRCIRTLIFLISVVPFLHAGQRPDDFEIWNPVVSAADLEEPRPWHLTTQISDEIAELKSRLPAQSQIVVLPPVRSVTYLLVEARQSNGYAFGGPPCLDGVNWDELDAAIILEAMDDRETTNWQESDCDSAMLSVTNRGFERTYRGARFSLWQPPSNK